MAFNPLHDPKHLSMKGSSQAFFSRVFGCTEKLIVCEENRQWPNVRVIDKF